jgi:hypothetical protein
MSMIMNVQRTPTAGLKPLLSQYRGERKTISPIPLEGGFGPRTSRLNNAPHRRRGSAGEYIELGKTPFANPTSPRQHR